MLWIGADVSKGYIDVCWLSEQAQGTLHRFDDTPSGHRAWWAYLSDCQSQGESIHLGVESTGGLERNWMRSFRLWCKERDPQQLRCSLVDPRAVHRLAGTLPERCKTDPSSARTIAVYLRLMQDRLLEAVMPSGERSFVRSVISAQGRVSQVTNQMKALLPETHPSLVAYTQDNGFPNWVLLVLKRYPTTALLARARIATVAQIPYVTTARAAQLIQQAQATPVARNDEFTALHMRNLVDSYLMQAAHVDQQWTILFNRFEDHPTYQRLLTITGIGAKTAATWVAELPPIEHFRNASALIAFIGLDPVFEQSGDSLVQKGISHRGSSALRQMLYMAARSAATHNPAIRRFYSRLRGAGKSDDQALVACMAKLVRIAYACIIAEKDFDPKHGEAIQVELTQAEPTATDQRIQKAGFQRTKAITAGQEKGSPISRRERKRRTASKKQQPEAQRGHSLKKTGFLATERLPKLLQQAIQATEKSDLK